MAFLAQKLHIITANRNLNVINMKRVLIYFILITCASEKAMASHDSIANIALSAQVALFKKLEIIASNVANADTPGFKQKKMLFVTHNVQTNDEQNKIISYVNDISTYRDYSNGTLKFTGHPMDLGIIGDGYFMVEAPNGLHYTRDGNFYKLPNGTLVTKHGYSVMSAQRNNIVIPANATTIVINKLGQIFADGTLVNTVGVFKFQNQNNLKEVGQSMYKSDAANPALDPEQDSFTLVQGMLEGSNVNKVAAIADLIDTQNHAKSVSVIIASYDDITRKAISSLSSISTQ